VAGQATCFIHALPSLRGRLLLRKRHRHWCAGRRISTGGGAATEVGGAARVAAAPGGGTIGVTGPGGSSPAVLQDERKSATRGEYDEGRTQFFQRVPPRPMLRRTWRRIGRMGQWGDHTWDIVRGHLHLSPQVQVWQIAAPPWPIDGRARTAASMSSSFSVDGAALAAGALPALPASISSVDRRRRLAVHRPAHPTLLESRRRVPAYFPAPHDNTASPQLAGLKIKVQVPQRREHPGALSLQSLSQ